MNANGSLRFSDERQWTLRTGQQWKTMYTSLSLEIVFPESNAARNQSFSFRDVCTLCHPLASISKKEIILAPNIFPNFFYNINITAVPLKLS